MQALSKKKTGDICTIKWMFGIPEILDFLRSRKIEEGSTIQVIQKMDGGLILGMDGKRIALCDEQQTEFRCEIGSAQQIENEWNLEKRIRSFSVYRNRPMRTSAPPITAARGILDTRQRKNQHVEKNVDAA